MGEAEGREGREVEEESEHDAHDEVRTLLDPPRPNPTLPYPILPYPGSQPSENPIETQCSTKVLCCSLWVAFFSDLRSSCQASNGR